MTLNSDAVVRSVNENKNKVFHFCIFGLSARNEILLQSMVRLLHGVTRHEWRHAADARDLLIAGFGDPKLPSTKDDLLMYAPADMRARLWVGDGRGGDLFGVGLPLEFKQLGAALDQVGTWLLAAPSSLSAEVSRPPADQPDALLQLLRWPPSGMLSSPERTKAAAILLRTAVELSDLARRSGMEPAECRRFVANLPHVKWTRPLASAPESNCVLDVSPGTPAPTAPLQSRHQASLANAVSWARGNGILARIRSRLGLAV